MSAINLNLIECPPTIRPGALITWCGESPGWQEVRDKEGFVGGGGRLLEKVCFASSIDISKTNKTNVVKRRPSPGSDDFGVFYLDPKKRTQPTEELKWWRNLLIAELTKYRPNLVVALGNEALKALCPPKSGITSWRGSILESSVIPGLKVIPEVHPAFVMRDHWEYYYLMIRTFKRKVFHESKSPTKVLHEPPEEFIIDPTLDQVLQWLEHIARNPHLQWFLDVETRGDTLSCFGLWIEDRPYSAICVPIQKTTGPAWSVSDEATIWKGLSVAMDQNPRLCNQNIIYDLDYLLDHGCEPSGIESDPMIKMNVCYPEFPKGLDFTTSLYTYHDYYKDEGKTWKKKTPDRQVWIYNCKDMVVTPKVDKCVTADLKETKLYEIYQRKSHAMYGVALEMQRNRLKLNRIWHSKIAGVLAEERTARHKDLTSIIGREINVKSRDQVAYLLYDEMRLPVKRKRGTESVTTEENAIKELRAANPENRVLTLIIQERHLRTKESNQINVKFDRDPDGSLYLGYQPSIGGAKSFRWAFSKSPKWRGASPQTISKVIRLMYEPPTGNVFWQRDLNQGEVKITAWLANCRYLMDIFEGPIKIHKIVGGDIFRKKPEDIVSDSLEYDTAKSVVHAYDYMMRYRRLAIEANIPFDMAKMVLDNYGAKVPEIPQYHQWVKETTIKTGKLVNPFGQERTCYRACGMLANTGQLGEEIWRDLVSWIPQSMMPAVINPGMLECFHAAPYARWHQQGHDSYLASGPPNRTEEFYNLSQQAADKVHFIIKGQDRHLSSEFQWGYLWGAMLKYEPGEDTSYEAWLERATKEEYFNEALIKEKLYSLF